MGGVAVSLQWPMHHRVRFNRCANAALLLLGCALLQSATGLRAFGSCGDWLAHPGQSPSTAERTGGDSQMPAPAKDSVGRSLASGEQPSPLPCDGPSCRNAPPKPIPASPPSTVNASDKLLLASHDIVCDALSRWSFAGNNTSAHALRGFPVDIEHPPRS